MRDSCLNLQHGGSIRDVDTLTADVQRAAAYIAVWHSPVRCTECFRLRWGHFPRCVLRSTEQCFVLHLTTSAFT